MPSSIPKKVKSIICEKGVKVCILKKVKVGVFSKGQKRVKMKKIESIYV